MYKIKKASEIVNSLNNQGFFVYKINFKCGRYYIGATSNILNRFNSHFKSINHKEDSNECKSKLIHRDFNSLEELLDNTLVYEVRSKKSMFTKERNIILMNYLDDSIINSFGEISANPFDEYED